MFVGDGGGDGDIATFYFRVPDNAQSGAVYPIEVYYRDGDLFTNSAANDSYLKHFRLFHNRSSFMRIGI